MKAPFPYFGGKARIASQVWTRLGSVTNYVEPFFGSGAVLLSRPATHDLGHVTETVNDLDGMIANFWRAVAADPDAVAHHADWPCNENDLTARHAWLVGEKERLQQRLESDPGYYDAKIAGWWVWGICLWIGTGWCSGNGPWTVQDSQLMKLARAGRGINRQLVHLGGAGQGINRQLVHLGNARRGAALSINLRAMMGHLSDRLRRVRVCCGDWGRICGPSPTFKHGLTGVFLDPPYGAGRDTDIYSVDSLSIATEVMQWARQNGDNPLLRIALCGYEDEYDLPGWAIWRWKAHGGYGVQGKGRGRQNCMRECVWFSPHCLKTDLFAWAEGAVS